MQHLKQPVESATYHQWSQACSKHIDDIISKCIKAGDNQILIKTNLKKGLPLENINKIAGPFIEAWVQEKFKIVCLDTNNKYALINVETGLRLHPYDVILQFKRNNETLTANVDVKSTSTDIATAGKNPNLTAYGRIRTEYVNDPDYIFIILSLRHKVYNQSNMEADLTEGVLEIISSHCFDLKYLRDSDLHYNPALGTGQLQIKDINYIKLTPRTTAEFCKLLDKKFIASQGQSAFNNLATKFGWYEGTNQPVNTEVINNED